MRLILDFIMVPGTRLELVRCLQRGILSIYCATMRLWELEARNARKTRIYSYGRQILPTLPCLILIACGGGGSSDSAPVPVPVVLKTVVFMGDSITANWPLSDYFPNAINKGIPGQDPQSMLARFGSDVLALKPVVVVILAGTNCPHPVSITEGDAACVAAIISMAQQAQGAGIKVIIGLIPPRLFAIEPYNAALKLAATANGFTLVDFYTPMVLPDFNEIPALFADGTHPNKAGYDVMAAALGPVLAEALR